MQDQSCEEKGGASSPLPRELWRQIDLTPSGLPRYFQSEVVTLNQKNVRVDFSEDPCFQMGDFIITTHRMIHISQQGHLGLHLSGIAFIELKKGSLFRQSSKICCFLNQQGPQVDGSAAAAAAAAAAPSFALAFKGGGREEGRRALATALERRAWVQVEEPASAVAAQSMGTAGAGVSGLLRRQQRKQQRLAQLGDQAFSDLGGLIGRAKEVVAVLERYTASHPDEESSEKETSDLNAALATIGYVNPVSRRGGGGGGGDSVYLAALARQLADFIHERRLLARAGGMVALHDLWCLYSRAQGGALGALVSPDDLRKACGLLRDLNLGMSLRQFDSGVLAVQSDQRDDAATAARLAGVAAAKGGLDAVRAAAELGVPAVLARQYLLSAEATGQLARDESVEGLLFYPNRFAEFCAR